MEAAFHLTSARSELLPFSLNGRPHQYISEFCFFESLTRRNRPINSLEGYKEKGKCIKNKNYKTHLQ